jgi:hypothetical protein
VGDTLTYRVETNHQEYDLLLTLTQLSDTGVRFSYVTTQPANRQGQVEMTPEALQTAMCLYTIFAGGTVKLKDQTSVFVSKEFTRAAKRGYVVLFTDTAGGKAPDTLRQLQDIGLLARMKIHKQVGGRLLNFSGPILHNTSGTKIIGLLSETDYPFITVMQDGFKMYLTKVAPLQPKYRRSR